MEYHEPKSTLNVTIFHLELMLKKFYSEHRLKKFEFEMFIKELDKLHDVHDSLEFYDNHPLYMLLHKELHRMFKNRVPVYSFLIKINLRPGHHAPALLEFNLFPQEKKEVDTTELFG